jgi:DNA topoisomerase-3
MRPLADAAVCRSESDWLVGINGTRAMTAFNSRSGGFQLTTVGRVQTPTLAILVNREAKIRAFRPRGYWEVLGTFRAAGGEYEGRWFDEKFEADDDPTRVPNGCGRGFRACIVASAGRANPARSLKRPYHAGRTLALRPASLQREANGDSALARTTLSPPGAA